MKKIIEAIFWIVVGGAVFLSTLVTVFIMGMSCLSYLNHISPLPQTANSWLVLCILMGSLAISLSVSYTLFWENTCERP